MSTALSHLSGAPVGLLSGAVTGYSYADLLREQFEPEANRGDCPNSPNGQHYWLPVVENGKIIDYVCNFCLASK